MRDELGKVSDSRRIGERLEKDWTGIEERLERDWRGMKREKETREGGEPGQHNLNAN